MISICPLLKISLNLVPCRSTQAAWQKQSGGLQTADSGLVSSRAPCVSHIVCIFFPYCFHIISTSFHILSIFFSKNMQTIWNKSGKHMEGIWIPWFPESGKIMEKIWNKLGKQYGIHIENYGITVKSHCAWTKRPSTSKCRRSGDIPESILGPYFSITQNYLGCCVL